VSEQAMEKYYCDHCRLLYNDEDVCKVCGSTVNHKIKIEVQHHQSIEER
jgi:rRNA maturation endonuclease Nob1